MVNGVQDLSTGYIRFLQDDYDSYLDQNYVPVSRFDGASLLL